MQLFHQLHAFLWESFTENNCNTFLIDGATRVLIDPGHLKHFAHVEQKLQELHLRIEEIGVVICTHAHPDHMEAIQLFKKTPALIAMHEEEWQLVKGMGKHFNINLRSITPDFFLKEGDLSIKGLELQVFHTPGHSPGSASFYWPSQKALFAGDVVFKNGLGRTDLPGGNSDLIKKSITGLSQLETEWLLPGHGEIISGKNEVKANFSQLEHEWFSRL